MTKGPDHSNAVTAIYAALFRLVPLLTWQKFGKGGFIGTQCSGKNGAMRAETYHCLHLHLSISITLPATQL